MRALSSRVGAPGPELGPCAAGFRPELPKEPRSGAGPKGACSGYLHVHPRVGPGVEKAGGAGACPVEEPEELAPRWRQGLGVVGADVGGA